MAIRGARVTVTTEPTLLTAPEADAYAGESLAITGNPDELALGDADVTFDGDNGAHLAADRPLSIDVQPGEQLYAVVASGTSVVDVLRSSL